MSRARKADGKTALTPDLASYAPVCDAIALLFQPYAEVVLHDLATETVVHLSNPFSKRELGEPSLLHEIDFKPTDIIIGPYEKVNWDGRRIKSVSAVLRSGERAIGVLCINVDVSHFHAVMQTLTALVAVPQSPEKPASLFKEDWHERINEYIQSWTRERGLTIAEMSRRPEAAARHGSCRRRRLRRAQCGGLYLARARPGPRDGLQLPQEGSGLRRQKRVTQKLPARPVRCADEAAAPIDGTVRRAVEMRGIAAGLAMDQPTRSVIPRQHAR